LMPFEGQIPIFAAHGKRSPVSGNFRNMLSEPEAA